ncbi:MAG: hypothetical protein NTU97_00830 [Candidatus Magasanikbacteria bacterium]|nr:hypothetical protein [Candidatus Magasanikbacteria bacterium]
MFSEKPNYAEEAAQSPFMGTRKAKTLMILIYRIIALYQNHNAGNLSEEIFRQYEFAKRVRDASDEAALARALKELAPD